MIADLTVEQQQIRRGGIGASEIAAVCGLSPWAGPLDIYLAKKGLRAERPDTKLTIYGKAMESGARELYAYQTGRAVTIPGVMIHPQHTIVRATPDGIADDVTTVQIKCPRHWAGWGETGTHDFPDLHWLQITWEMAAAGKGEADLVCFLSGEHEVRVYPACTFDAKFFETLLETAERFWRDHIVADKPPQVDGSRAAADYIRETFPREKHANYVLDESPDTVRLVANYVYAKDEADDAETRKAEARNRLAALIGDAPGISGSWGSVTFKASARSSLDKDALFASFRITDSDIAAHTTKTFSRSIRVNLKKGK